MPKYVFVCMECGNEYYEHEIEKVDNKHTIELICPEPDCRCESIEVYIEKEAD